MPTCPQVLIELAFWNHHRLFFAKGIYKGMYYFLIMATTKSGKRNVKAIRFDDVEIEMIGDLAHELGVSESEAVRRSLWTVSTLYSGKLALSDALKPIPELMKLVSAQIIAEKKSRKRK